MILRTPFRTAPPAALGLVAHTAFRAVRHSLRGSFAASALLASMPLAAQEQAEGFNLPPAAPTPTPTPAGPADERAGVAIPPRGQPEPSPAVTATPVIQPLPIPRLEPAPPPSRKSVPTARSGAPATTSVAPAPTPSAFPLPTESAQPPLPTLATPPSGAASPVANPPEPAAGAISADERLPAWWPYAAGALGALVLLGGGAWLWRRRKPKVLRLSPPTARAQAEGETAASAEVPRLDLTLEIISATRSVMMFTLAYRLTIANRSDGAVNDLHAAVQLACARASGGSGASAGAAQGLETIARIGPHQSRSVTGTVQLPLNAIQPLRQGQTPLFIPLAHVTLEGEGQPATTKSFVIGPRSASGRVHPIPLDQPPGGIAGLVAQAIALPPADAAA